MSTCFVLSQLFSNFTTHLTQVADSKFSVSDQYSGGTSSAVLQAIGHKLLFLCRSVVEEEIGQLLGPFMIS